MDALTLIQQLGFPVAMLLFAGYAIWKAGSWVGQNILLPVVTRHIQFLDSVERSLTSITNTQHEMAVTMRGINCQTKPPLPDR